MFKKLGLLVCLICSIASAVDFDGHLTVETPGGTSKLGFVEFGKVRFTTTDQIASLADNRFYSAIKRKESLSIAGESYTFSPNSQFVVVAEKTYDMPQATRMTGSALYVPLVPFLEILADRAKFTLEVKGESAVLGESRKKASVKAESEPVVKAETAEPSPAEQVRAQIEATPNIRVEEEPKEEPSTEKTPIRKKKWSLMIDAGHGGKDPGASSKDGIREKVIVLDIAKKVSEALKGDSLFTISLTRSDDTFLPLQKRTDLANKKSADIFVSIHCNAAKNKAARGTQVFFLAPARSDHARATAALENSSIFLEDPSDSLDDLDFIMADVIQNEFLRESSRLAVLVEEAIAQKTNLPARGPAGAGFYVLKGSFMPAILIEAAFLSNVDDAKLLAEESFRRKIAVGIAEGIRQFIVELPE